MPRVSSETAARTYSLRIKMMFGRVAEASAHQVQMRSSARIAGVTAKEDNTAS